MTGTSIIALIIWELIVGAGTGVLAWGRMRHPVTWGLAACLFGLIATVVLLLLPDRHAISHPGEYRQVR